MARYSFSESKWETITPFHGREIHLWTWDHANTIYVWTLSSPFDVRTHPRGFVYSINTNKWIEEEDICKPIVSSAFCTDDFDKTGCDTEYEALLLQKYWLVGQGPWQGLHKNNEITEDMKEVLVKFESFPFSERVQYFKTHQKALLPVFEKALELVLPFRTLVLIFQLLHAEPSLAEVLLPVTKQYKRHYGQYPNGSYWFTLKPESRSHFGLTSSGNSNSTNNTQREQGSSSPNRLIRPNFSLLQAVRSPSSWTIASPTSSPKTSGSPSPVYLSPSTSGVLSRSGSFGIDSPKSSPPILTLPPTPTFDLTGALPPITPNFITSPLPPPYPHNAHPLPALSPLSPTKSTPSTKPESPRFHPSSPTRPTTSPRNPLFSPTSYLSLASPRLQGAISPSPRGLMTRPSLASSLPIQLSTPSSPRTTDQPHMPSPTSTSTSWALTRSKEIKDVEHSRNRVLQLLREKNIEVPLLYVCPITKSLMFEPVLTEDGSMYERKAIQMWFTAGNTTSPKTELQLSSTKTYPCLFARSIISDFIAKSLPGESYCVGN